MRAARRAHHDVADPARLAPGSLALYEEGLIAGGHSRETRERLLRDVAVWRHVYLAESQAQAEDELAAALLQTRRHMLHARSAHNPEDYRVDPAVLNPFNDPRASEDEAIRFSMDTALCGTPDRVAEQMAALRDVGVHHVLCQMSFGYLGHESAGLDAAIRRAHRPRLRQRHAFLARTTRAARKGRRSACVSLTGKSCVVTGASRGLGRAIALAYAAQGADLVLTARSRDDLERLRAEIEALGRRAEVRAGDVTDLAHLRAVGAAAVSAFGKLDVWVNNAAATLRSPAAGRSGWTSPRKAGSGCSASTSRPRSLAPRSRRA